LTECIVRPLKKKVNDVLHCPLRYTSDGMPHGKYMRGTRLDYLIAFGSVLFLILVMTAAINPFTAFKLKRDEYRSDDVREIMSAILQLSVDNPPKYQALLNRMEGREGLRLMLGDAVSCAGDFGAYCSDTAVPDDCLPTDEVFKEKNPELSFAYYVSLREGMVKVGACEAETRPVFLESLVR
jgi:hypothetical protein